MYSSIFNKLTAVMLVCISFNLGLNAQTVIWGVGSTNGVAEAEFQNPLLTATTATFNATSWTAQTISNDDGAGTVLTPGAAFWVRTITGVSQGGYATNMTAIASPSQANGAAIFDSDFMDNGGTAGAFGTGTAPADQVGDLVSPTIDLTGYADSALVLGFHCKWRAFQVNNFWVSMSIDDGLTWTDVDVNTLLPSPTNTTAEGYVVAPFYTLTQGATNLTQCRIRYRFDGNYYYAAVDDLSISVAQEYDIAIGLPDPSGNNLASAYEDVRMGNYRFISKDNFEVTDLKEWFWGIKVVNNGYQDILPAQSPQAFLQVDFADPLTGLTTTAVYIDTIDIIDTLPAGAADYALPVETLRDLNFVDLNGVGDYNVSYWVQFAGNDANAENDTIKSVFTITDNNYTSKCRLSQDGKVFASRPIFPGGTDFSAFEYGSLYYFPNGASDSVKLDSVDIRYYVSNGYSGSASQTLVINVYQFEDGANGGTADGILDASGGELTQVGLGAIQISQVVPNGTYGVATATNIVDPAQGGTMAPFVDGGFYMVSIFENPSAFGGAATFNSNTGIWFGADEINYAINAALTDVTDYIPHPSPVKVVDGTGAGDWNWVGFGADIIPSIGLHLSFASPVLDVETVYETEGVNLSLFPNPATDLLNMNVSFEEATNVMYILTDVAGHVLNITNADNVTNDQQTLDVSKLAAGVYMVTAKTAKGTTTKRFVKQ